MQVGIGPRPRAGSGSVSRSGAPKACWTLIFLIVTLEIRREVTGGSLRAGERRRGADPGGDRGGASHAGGDLSGDQSWRNSEGMANGADTGIAFTLGVLAIFGVRASGRAQGVHRCLRRWSTTSFRWSSSPSSSARPARRVADRRGARRGVTLFALCCWRVYALWIYWAVGVGTLVDVASGRGERRLGRSRARRVPAHATHAERRAPCSPRRQTRLRRTRSDRQAARTRKDVDARPKDRAGTDLGLGQPQPVRRRRAAAIAGPNGWSATSRGWSTLCGPAAVRLYRRRRAADGRHRTRPDAVAVLQRRRAQRSRSASRSASSAPPGLHRSCAWPPDRPTRRRWPSSARRASAGIGDPLSILMADQAFPGDGCSGGGQARRARRSPPRPRYWERSPRCSVRARHMTAAKA